MSFSNLNRLELITLISPIFTYWLLAYVSGINILEKNADKKKIWRSYVNNQLKSKYSKLFDQLDSLLSVSYTHLRAHETS